MCVIEITTFNPTLLTSSKIDIYYLDLQVMNQTQKISNLLRVRN